MNPPEDALAALYAVPGAAGYPAAASAPFSAAAAVLGIVARLVENPEAAPDNLRREWLSEAGTLDAELTVIAACILLARMQSEDPETVLAGVRLRLAGGGAR